MKLRRMILGVCIGAAACGGDGVQPEDDRCNLQSLPLSGADDGPVLVDVGLEIQAGEGVIIVATATDPQGSENLRDVLQSVGVYPDEGCRGTPRTLLDDLVGSGVEETFGTAVDADTDAALVATIAAALSWPVQVDFVDLDGHRTQGDLLARIIR
jgi:hypothetical protein